MPRYRPEPAFAHDQPEQTAVLLVNLGTPDAPTGPALRRYLAEFLSDPRVVEIPRPVWWPILHGVILNLRPKRSAEKYAKIWMPEGSPLRVHTERLAKLLRGSLGAAGHPQIRVDWAMRYGEPSVGAALERLRASRATRILLLPMYPQYAASTTASALDALARGLLSWRHVPELRYVKSYHDHPFYVAALAQSVLDHWQARGRPDKLVMSFHGVPRRTLTMGDPYHCQCQKTGRLLAEALGLGSEQYVLTFQSRFGRAEWLQPYTQPTLEALARQGVKRVDVICPGFPADCLETLEEIGLECKAAFLEKGGREFHYIPCLNERADHVAALTAIALSHLGEWTRVLPETASVLELRQQRARRLGAVD